jgi:hypothetical protein
VSKEAPPEIDRLPVNLTAPTKKLPLPSVRTVHSFSKALQPVPKYSLGSLVQVPKATLALARFLERQSSSSALLSLPKQVACLSLSLSS